MKYLKYIRNLLLNKKWEMVFYIDDIVLSLQSAILIPERIILRYTVRLILFP